MHDCYIRVIYNIVTALLEYLDLLVVFPEAYYIDLILFVTFLVDHLWNAKYAKLQFSDTHFSKFSPIFQNFALLAFYFAKKFASKNPCSPRDVCLHFN